MFKNGIHGAHGSRNDGRELPYRSASDDWMTWSAAGGVTYLSARGTDGDDVFIGTDADDQFRGLSGNDTISGAGGDDKLFGDDGDDIVNGGPDNDNILGGAGEDTINGGAGDDVILGGLGRDMIRGGAGNDFIKPDEDGGDLIYGGAGNDSVTAGYSIINGNNGDDHLVGTECIMKGGAGNDRLEIFGGFLIDQYGHEVWGGSGLDSFVFLASDGYIGGGTQEIHDLTNEDTIDLSQIDAKQFQPGDQDFVLVEQRTGHAGEVTIRYDPQTDRTLIELFTDNGDTPPGGTIIVPGDHADFVNFVF